MKVAYLVHSRTFAGTERHILGISRELRRTGHSVLIACPPSAERLRKAALDDGFEVTGELAIGRSRMLDVIHAHDGRSTLAGVVAAAGRDAIFVRTQHFVHPASVNRTGLRKILSVRGHRVVNSRLDGYICVSRAAARATEERRDVSAPVAVIPPGIQVPDSAVWHRSVADRLAANHPVVVSAGRLEDERSFDTLIRAVALVRLAHPTCQVLIAGTGTAEPRLRGLADELGLSNVIRWLGWVPDLTAVLTDAHLYVNPWPAEGFGMATAEAMAAGVPVLVTTSGAAPELVAGGVGGWTVPPRDPSALAERMSELLVDRHRLAAEGARARGRAVSLYSVESAAAAMCDFYEALFRRRGSE